MTKSFIIVLLFASMLLQGCTTYTTLTRQDIRENRPAEDESVIIILKDGSQIESDAYHHISVPKSDDCIYGVGKHVSKTSRKSTFRGKLLRSLIDSTTTEQVGSNRYFVCWLSDSSYVRFNESDYVVITPEQGAGFWCSGTLKNQEGRSLFKGQIPTEKIDEFQAREVSGENTAYLILGILVPPGILLIILASADWR